VHALLKFRKGEWVIQRMDVEDDDKTTVFVEAQQRIESRADRAKLLERVEGFISTALAVYRDGPVDFSTDEILSMELEKLCVTDIALRKKARTQQEFHLLLLLLLLLVTFSPSCLGRERPKLP
jgi:hypothetical protein